MRRLLASGESLTRGIAAGNKPKNAFFGEVSLLHRPLGDAGNAFVSPSRGAAASLEEI